MTMEFSFATYSKVFLRIFCIVGILNRKPFTQNRCIQYYWSCKYQFASLSIWIRLICNIFRFDSPADPSWVWQSCRHQRQNPRGDRGEETSPAAALLYYQRGQDTLQSGWKYSRAETIKRTHWNNCDRVDEAYDDYVYQVIKYKKTERHKIAAHTNKHLHDNINRLAR